MVAIHLSSDQKRDTYLRDNQDHNAIVTIAIV